MKERTLVEVDVEVPQLREGEHLDEARVFIVEALPEGGEVMFGELPVLPLRRFPVIGRHLRRFCPLKAVANA
jgi:hypothetical protein